MGKLRDEKLHLSGLLIAALGAVGVASPPAFAQMDAGASGGSAARISIAAFQLAGNGCPTRNSTAALTDGPGDRKLLQIRFGGGGAAADAGVEADLAAPRSRQRFFEVSGERAQTRDCTARLTLSVEGDGVDIALESASENVRVERRSDAGQLVVRSQFLLEDQMSTVQAFELVNSPDPRELALLGDDEDEGSATRHEGQLALKDLDLRARGATTLNLASIVQLELAPGDSERDREEATLRLLDLQLQLRLVRPGGEPAVPPQGDPPGQPLDGRGFAPPRR